MRITLGLLGLFLATGVSVSAHAQAPPPGSYQQSCREIRMHGPTLTAVCRRANGRGEQVTALNIASCVGDIGNNNGHLQCSGGQAAAPAPQPPAYSGPGFAPAPGYSRPGYGPPPRYSEEGSYRERCQRLRHEEHEIRDRLAYTPYGEERERLQYRLGRIQAEREQCWRR